MEKFNKFYIIYLLEFTYIFLFIILYYNNIITNERFYSFILIISIILIYTRIIRYFQYNEKLKLVNNKNIYKWLIISKYKNIILYFIVFIELQLYNIILYLNSILKQYIVFVLYLLIMNLFIKPIKLLLYFYYKVIIRWSQLSILELLFKRIEGLIFSLLIFSNFYMLISNIIKGYELILLYFILIIINSVIEYNNGIIIFWKIKIIINCEYNNLLLYRFKVSIINICILKFVENNSIKINAKFKNFIFYWFIENNFNSLIDYCKFEVINYWKYMKLEFKNQPSLVLYYCLYKLYDSNLFFNNLLDNKFYLEKHKDIRIIELIKYLYQFDELKVKLLIFLLWDIEAYYGILNINHYKSYIDLDLACLDIQNVLNKLTTISNIKIKKSNNINTFYDLDFNFVFFNKLYIILNNNKAYKIHINLIENDLNNRYDRILDCYNNIENEENLVLWISDYVNHLRKNWVQLSLDNKIELYTDILYSLYENDAIGINLFKASWINDYINIKNKNKVLSAEQELIDLINQLEADGALIEVKKSRIRKFFEYFFHSM